MDGCAIKGPGRPTEVRKFSAQCIFRGQLGGEPGIVPEDAVSHRVQLLALR